jgi:hypothetical protein
LTVKQNKSGEKSFEWWSGFDHEEKDIYDF